MLMSFCALFCGGGEVDPEHCNVWKTHDGASCLSTHRCAYTLGLTLSYVKVNDKVRCNLRISSLLSPLTQQAKNWLYNDTCTVLLRSSEEDQTLMCCPRR